MRAAAGSPGLGRAGAPIRVRAGSATRRGSPAGGCVESGTGRVVISVPQAIPASGGAPSPGGGAVHPSAPTHPRTPVIRDLPQALGAAARLASGHTGVDAAGSRGTP